MYRNEWKLPAAVKPWQGVRCTLVKTDAFVGVYESIKETMGNVCCVSVRIKSVKHFQQSCFHNLQPGFNSVKERELIIPVPFLFLLPSNKTEFVAEGHDSSVSK